MIVARKYLDLFVEEGAELLSKLYDGVLRFEGKGCEKHALDETMRLAHTLKGGAKMVGLDNVSSAAHRLEGALQGLSLPEAEPGRVVDATPFLLLLDEIQAALAVVDAEGQAADSVPHVVSRPAPAAMESRTLESHGGAGARPADRIRVSLERLDDLQNLLDDLSVVQAKILRDARQVRDAFRTVDRVSGSLDRLPAGAERERLAALLHGVPAQGGTKLLEGAHELAHLAAELRHRVLELRMVPLSELFEEFGRGVRDLARELGKEVSLSIEGHLTELDRGLLEAVQGPMRHLVRNALDHGLETPGEREAAGKPRSGLLSLRAYHKGSAVVVEVEDDGRGLDAQAIREKALSEGFVGEKELGTLADDEVLSLLCEPGFTTSAEVTEISGRGVGLDAVRAQVEQLKGSLSIEGQAGVFSRFRLFLPLAVSGLSALVVRSGGLLCAVPTLFVDQCVKISHAQLAAAGGAIVHRDRNLPVVGLGAFFGGPEAGRVAGGLVSVVVLQCRGRYMALQVDELVSETQTVVKPLGEHLRGVQYVLGVSFLDDEQPVPILNVVDLHLNWAHFETDYAFRPRADARRLRALVVDDSVTTRHLEKLILEGLGYVVLQASDGFEALDCLGREPVDVVLTDVEMPSMDGLDLARTVRERESLSHLPLVMVSNRGEAADVEAGLAAGADAYMRKDSFDQRELGETLNRLLRERGGAGKAQGAPV